MFFFIWTYNVFPDPTGKGNIDLRDDDVNNLPIGLTTSSTTTDVTSPGAFKIILKHST